MPFSITRRRFIRILTALAGSTQLFAKHGAAAVGAAAADEGSERQDLILWYRQPADRWNDALPIGNGRLGAMVFGGVG